MPVVSTDQLGFPDPQKPVLALDISPGVIGLALGIAALDLITPLPPLARGRFEADGNALARVIRDHGPVLLVAGWPLNMDGTEGPRCQSVKDTVMALDAHLAGQGISVPFTFQDERLSTKAADNYLDTLVDIKQSKRDRMVDSTAACVILDRFFNP